MLKRLVAVCALLCSGQLLAADAGIVSIASGSGANGPYPTIHSSFATYTAGNKAIVYVRYETPTAVGTMTCSDENGSFVSIGSSWTEIGTFSSAYGSTQTHRFGYMEFSGTGSTRVFCSFSVPQNWPSIIVMQRDDIPGAFVSGEYAIQDQTGNTSASLSSGNTPTLADANSVLVGFACTHNVIASPDADTGFDDAGEYINFGGSFTDSCRVETKQLAATTATAATFLASVDSTFTAPLALVFTQTAPSSSGLLLRRRR